MGRSLAATVFLALWALPGLAQGSSALEAAEAAFAAGDFAKVVETAGPALEGSEQATAVRLHYLLGKALYEKTRAEVVECRERGEVTKGRMLPDQAKTMKAAVHHFQSVYDKDPASPLAPESLYMTGQILDFGCLNHFKEAADQYALCAEKYPDNEYGVLSGKRAAKLKESLRKGVHGGFH